MEDQRENELEDGTRTSIKKKDIVPPNNTEQHGDVKSFLKFLLQRSSINGVNRIGTEANWIRRGIWSTVLIVGIVGCSIQCHRFLTSYFSYPVVVNLEVTNNWLSEFPAVTICNLNRVNRIRMQKYCKAKGRHYAVCASYITEPAIARAGFPFTPYSSPGVPILGIKQQVTCKQFASGPFSDEKNKTLLFLSQYAQLPEKFRVIVGHQFRDMVHLCAFNGEPCTIKNFTIHPPSLTLGNCFTFNGQGPNISVSTNTQSVGVESGLHLELNLESGEYLDLTESVGARLSIHDFSATPIPAEDGFNVAPGQETLIGIKKTTVKRLPPPYKDMCFDYAQDIDARDRSQESCFRSCFQNHTLRLCNCSNPFMKGELNSNTRVCDLNSADDVCCLESVEDYFRNTTDENICVCPLPCTKNYYDTTTSFSFWPSEAIVNKRLEQPTLVQNALKTPSNFRKNFAKVRVFYRTLERTVYKQIPMYQDSEIFSQLGGQLGLFLGVSLIALFECLESAVLLIHFALRRKLISK